MLDKVPNVVYKQEFFLPNYKDKTNQDKRDYYSSNKYDDYLKYVATGIKDLEKLNFVEYSNNSIKSSGIFNQNGLMSKEQIAEFRKNIRETKSIIWSGIISFEENFGKKWCGCYEQAYSLVKSELPKYFKRDGLNPDNIEWFAGLRIGETLAFKWKNIDFENKTIKIERAITQNLKIDERGNVKDLTTVIGDTKRDIPVTDIVLETLKQWKERQSKRQQTNPEVTAILTSSTS